MQVVRQHAATMRPTIIRYLLRAVLVLFSALVVLSYSYALAVRLASGTLLPRQLISPIVVIVPFVLGWLIDRNHPGHTIAFLFLLMAFSSAVSIIVDAGWLIAEFLPAPYAPAVISITMVLRHTMWLPGVVVPLFFVPLYFPTGKLLSPRWRLFVVFVLSLLAWNVITTIFRPWPWPGWDIMETRALNGIAGSEPFFDASTLVVSVLSLPILPLLCLAVFLRYRRSRGVERTQMKWPIFAVACCIGLGIVFVLFPTMTDIDARYDYFLTWGISMLFPLSIGIAILRHNLWDINIILNRTLVYAGLTALIIVAYVAIVSLFGALFQLQTSTFAGVVAAGVIAVIFQPLRDRLQRRVDQLLYGERDDPSTVLTRLAHHVQTADSPTAILPNLVQTIAHALKIPHVAIWLPADVERVEPVVVWGEAPNNAQSVPLTYQQQTIGHLVVAPRGPGEEFNQHEKELLETIAALTATTVHAVQLSEELRRSRQRIVTAREDERRRLRRDLHDDLGPQLASQALGLEAVAQLIPANPEGAQALLDSLKVQAEEAIVDVRRVVHDLRPPALDDLGLPGALEQRASRYASKGLRFHVDLPVSLPELPAAVETAIYRIAQEAMTNVVRHAQATHCTVRLYRAKGDLMIEIRDDGRGVPPRRHSGVGLQAMEERVAELSGRLVLESLPGGGTLVRASFPLEAYGE